MAYEWLKTKHPIYEKNQELWRRNEERLRGDEEVLEELRPFDWEYKVTDWKEERRDDKRVKVPAAYGISEKYTARQHQASYTNFPDMMMQGFVGHLMRQAPRPGSGLSFGTLGEVDGPQTSKADLIWYNVDGRGNDGSEWPNWWTGLNRRAGATGHRWVYTEAPADPPTNAEGETRGVTGADVLAGMRPWLIEYSPLAVPNWHFEDGQLMWAFIYESRRDPRVEGDSFEGNENENGFLLLVKKGWEGFDGARADTEEGSEASFSDGGWWRFNAKCELEEAHPGAWDEKLGGEIPMFVHYYERDDGTANRPAMSRPGTTALGQLAVSYMNLASAADFDAWDAASSVQFLLGVDQESHNTAMEMLKRGFRYAPVPPVTDPASGKMVIPDVHDGSTGAVVAVVFDMILKRKRDEAREMAVREVTSTPDSSGRSKQAGFAENKAPRLSLMASETQQSQNTAIHFLEKRFGKPGGGKVTPTGSVKWPKEFRLLSVIEEIEEMFELADRAGMKSPALIADLLVAAAKEKGLIVSDEDDRVRDQLEAAGFQETIAELREDLGLRSAELMVDAAMKTLKAAGLFERTDGDEDGEPLDEATVRAALESAAQVATTRNLLDEQFGQLVRS